MWFPVTVSPKQIVAFVFTVFWNDIGHSRIYELLLYWCVYSLNQSDTQVIVQRRVTLSTCVIWLLMLFMITGRKNKALLGPSHMQVYKCECVCPWSCLCSVCMFASLVSVRGRVLFVLALGLAPWKCWLAAMTQRYSIREGKNEREREREEEVWAEPAA